MNFIHKRKFWFKKNVLTSFKENVFKKFIYKKINVITFAKEIFHEYTKKKVVDFQFNSFNDFYL